MPPTHEIFLSHSSDDKGLAEELCRELEEKGFSCWIAPRNIEPGVDYSQSLSAAISNSSIFLLILSSNADRSTHVRRELEIADRKKIPILPVRVENTQSFSNLDYFVSTLHWCDLLARPLGKNLRSLEEALNQRLGDPNSERLWTQLGGPLADRYGPTRPRTLLSLDGGGMRAFMTLETLARIEKLLAARSAAQRRFRLCDYFDFIAGSGTGGFFAIALAQGKTVDEIRKFWIANAVDMFGREVRPFASTFLSTSNPLSSRFTAALQKFIGLEGTLSPESLRCLIMVLVRNHKMNYAWPLTNNPLAKYNDLTRADSIRRVPLLPLARACLTWSALAKAEILKLSETAYTYEISDGTFTPYANPSFLLYQTATAKPYRLEWRRGERNLLLVSVGAGQLPLTSSSSGQSTTLEDLLIPFMSITNMDQDIKCRTVGRCIHGPVIDREIGDLTPRDAEGQPVPAAKNTGREFTYVRYQPELRSLALKEMGARDPQICDPERRFDLCSKADLESLCNVGKLAAEAVAKEHFDKFAP